MDQDSTHMVAASKVPMLKPDCNAPPITKVVEGVETIIAPTTAEEKAQMRLEAVEKRFGGNAATKKTQRNLLKQQYENFTASSSEVLDQTFDRLQKLISQLEIHGESISQEDVNKKFLRSLSPEWNTHTIVWRNKPEIDTLSMDDLYNNLKIYEPEVKGTSSSSTNTQNVSFVFANSSTNGAVNTTHGATTVSTQATAINSTTIDNLSDAVADGYANNEGKEILEEHWKEFFCECGLAEEWSQLTLHSWLTLLQVLTLRTSKLNAISYKTGLESVQARLLVYKKNEFVYEEDIKLRTVKLRLVKQSLKHFRERINGAPIIEEWVSDNEEDDVPQAMIEKKTFKPSFAKIEFVKPKQQEKTARKTVNHVDCKKKDSPCAKKNIVPRAILTKSGLVLVNTDRQVNAAHTKTTVNAARPMSYLSKIAHSTVKRPIHKNTTFKNSNFNQRVNTVKDNNVNIVRPKAVVNAARPKAVVNVASKCKPALGFMKPFGCPVTILNTIDHLCKFDGKADEGFFVGYSINSKAFRVFNSRIRIVEENLHVQFIVAGNQSNGNAGTKVCDDAGKARMETSSPDAGFKPSCDDGKKVDEDPRKDSEGINQEKEDNVNSTNNVNAVSTNKVNVAGGKISIKLPDDLNMPSLEDIVYSDDDEDVGAEADKNNLDAFMPVSPIRTTKVNKDHPVEQIIGDLNSTPQTRRMTKNLKEHGLFNSVQQRTNHKDFQNCLFALYLEII
ncbi:hypothetical protein Tco_0245906 [Tanacetum coccineum]